MKKLKMSQVEVDKLVTVGRIAAKPSVAKVGSVDVTIQISSDSKLLWQYKLWVLMLERACCQNLMQHYPTYKNTECCDEWLSFGNFLEWCNKEVGYKGKPIGMQLDKDLIIKGNKKYSPETCSFVPQVVNKLLTDSGAIRGEWPVGVRLHRRSGRFQSTVSNWGKLKHLGLFDTPEEAFLAYKTAKEAQIKAVANQYKHVLKPAVYESLMNWEI